MRILLTGSTGFVGRQLANRLTREHTLWTLTRTASGAPNEVVQDLGAPFVLARFPPEIDGVVHAGGIVGEAPLPPERYQAVNVESTRQLLDYAAAAGAKQFTLFSTGGVYKPAPGPLREDAELGTRGLYGRSKLDAEEVVRSRWHALAAVIVRPFFPFGPGQTGRLLPRLVECLRHGQAVSIDNREGYPFLNPLFIDDLCEYVCRLLTQSRSVVVNLAGPQIVSLRELAEHVGRELGVRPTFRVGSEPVGSSYVGDTRLACTLTAYRPRVGVTEGVQRVVKAFESARS